MLRDSLPAREQPIPKHVVFGMANILSARANVNEKFLKNSAFQHSNTPLGITISRDLVQKQISGRIQNREVVLTLPYLGFGDFGLSLWCLPAFMGDLSAVRL